METFMLKKLLFIAALALLAASPALAKSRHHAAPVAAASFSNAYGSLNDSTAVMQGRRMIGRDPDAGIRTRLFIQSQTGYYSK
jgi:hypothetical protein